MGSFLDYGNSDFRRIKNGNFVDKTGLISVLNEKIDTEQSFVCISRPRRFGKSVAAKMLYAYYDRSSDSRQLFEGIEITKSPDFEKHLNKYPTIYFGLEFFCYLRQKHSGKRCTKDCYQRLEKKFVSFFGRNRQPYVSFGANQLQDRRPFCFHH